MNDYGGLCDRLEAARKAATADGPWRVMDSDDRPGPHSREILDDEGSVAVCSGDNDGTTGTISADRAALIVAAVNALPALIAAARERDRLRAAVEGLAERAERHGYNIDPDDLVALVADTTGEA